MAVNNTNVLRSARKGTYICDALYSNLGHSLDRFSKKKKVPNIKFCPVKGELIHADTDMGGHDNLATMRTRLEIGVAWLSSMVGRERRTKIDYMYEEL